MSNHTSLTLPRLPHHIAIIMDGNGRWAKQRGLPRIAGHREGVKTLQDIVKETAAKNIEALTIYAFSSENWNRPRSEVNMLLDLFMSSLKEGLDKLHRNHVRLNFIGDKSVFPDKLQDLMNEAMLHTENNTGLCLNVAANYGGRWDIANACKSILIEYQKQPFDPDKIDPDYVQSFLSLANLPTPELFIRTGGEIRISNFLLWHLAYTELYFTETLWPDFSLQEFNQALDWFMKRERRFGRTSEQLENINSA